MLSLGITLVPLYETLEELIELQMQMRKIDPLTPQLGLSNNLPHITILQGQSERELVSVDELAAIGEQFCISVPSLTLEVKSFSYFPAGWYFLMTGSIAELRSLQQSVLQICADRIRIPAERDTSTFTPAELEQFKWYGTRGVGECYHPHLTLGRTEAQAPSPREAELREIVESAWLGQSIPIERVCLCALGENGSHSETIYSIEL